MLFAVITFFSGCWPTAGALGGTFSARQNRAARATPRFPLTDALRAVWPGGRGVGVAALVMVPLFRLGARLRTGRDLLMPALTAAVLGGANIYGGSGSIVGMALAALLVGYLQQGLQMVGIPNQVSSAVRGAVGCGGDGAFAEPAP